MKSDLKLEDESLFSFGFRTRGNPNAFFLVLSVFLLIFWGLLFNAMVCTDGKIVPEISEPSRLYFNEDIVRLRTQYYNENKKMLDDIGTAFLNTNYHGELMYYRYYKCRKHNKFYYYPTDKKGFELSETYSDVLNITGNYIDSDSLDGASISYNDGVLYCRFGWPSNIYDQAVFLVCTRKPEAELSKILCNYPIYRKITDDITTGWIYKINANWYIVSPDKEIPENRKY